jgi:hypothetical protein
MEENEANNPEELEVLPPSALGELVRGEIDIQIATAHKYPRSIALFKKRALEMVSLDEDTAASCIYSRPVGKERGVMKYAEGMSVRLAEIVGACYGNLRVGSTVVEITPRHVTTRGYAHDLESNYASASEVIESTVDKSGNPYSERMRTVVAKAALAKARRDATFVVVPRALCKPLEERSRQIAIGDGTTLAKRRAAVMGWINKLGIPTERVFAALGIKGEEDIGLDQLTTLTGLKTSIKDGEVTVDEAFPLPGDTKKAAKPDWEHVLENQPAGTITPGAPDGPPLSEQIAIAKDLPPKRGLRRQRSEPVPTAAVKEPAGVSSPSSRDLLLYTELPDKESRAEFLAGLRRIGYRGTETAGDLSELPENVCDQILRDGVEELWAKARALAQPTEEGSFFFPDDREPQGPPD